METLSACNSPTSDGSNIGTIETDIQRFGYDHLQVKVNNGRKFTLTHNDNDAFSAKQLKHSGGEHQSSYDEPSYIMPSVLESRVDKRDANHGELIIKHHIEKNHQERKLYFGGYQHIQNNRIFYHASTQFGEQRQTLKDTGNLCCRETQTKQWKTGQGQTVREYGSQMERIGVYLDDSNDCIRIIRPYVDAKEFWLRRIKSIITIQRYWRGYSSRMFVLTIHRYRKMRLNTEEEQRVANAALQECIKIKEAHRREHPHTVKDFEVLYNELASWRDMQEKIIERLPEKGGLKQEAMQMLLQRETRLLQTIERQKQDATISAKQTKPYRALSLMSKPKQWELMNGNVVTVSTPWTIRATELQTLFHSLDSPIHDVALRQKTLLKIKEEVINYDCRLTKEIGELVDRELDLLYRGRSLSSLAGLRQRIRALFLRYIEIPDFNPEASRYMKVPPSHQNMFVEAIKKSASVYC